MLELSVDDIATDFVPSVRVSRETGARFNAILFEHSESSKGSLCGTIVPCEGEGQARSQPPAAAIGSRRERIVTAARPVVAAAKRARCERMFEVVSLPVTRLRNIYRYVLRRSNLTQFVMKR